MDYKEIMTRARYSRQWLSVLIGCETSGTVRDAFRRRNHDATSCDILPDDNKSPHHIRSDIMKVIKMGNPKPNYSLTDFWWDIIILFPPCTCLCVSGNRYYGEGKPLHHKRLEAIKWTKRLWALAKRHAPQVCMENPVGVLSSSGLKPKQYINPWQFGHGETKKTGLWLHNLEPLVPTNIVSGREQKVWKMGPSPERSKLRSKTYPGIARAMAKQFTLDN
tara:strand:- start:254 stop:913 length:660 start_codon:yes stop_codon:yes gene_type:complete